MPLNMFWFISVFFVLVFNPVNILFCKSCPWFTIFPKLDWFENWLPEFILLFVLPKFFIPKPELTVFELPKSLIPKPLLDFIPWLEFTLKPGLFESMLRLELFLLFTLKQLEEFLKLEFRLNALLEFEFRLLLLLFMLKPLLLLAWFDFRPKEICEFAFELGLVNPANGSPPILLGLLWFTPEKKVRTWFVRSLI